MEAPGIMTENERDRPLPGPPRPRLAAHAGRGGRRGCHEPPRPLFRIDSTWLSLSSVLKKVA